MDPTITTSPYRDDAVAVYADGHLLGHYWPREAPREWEDRGPLERLCPPGLHEKTPFHAIPLFSASAATHHRDVEEAVAALVAARQFPHREMVETYDSLRKPEHGVVGAVGYARKVLAAKARPPSAQPLDVNAK